MFDQVFPPLSLTSLHLLCLLWLVLVKAFMNWDLGKGSRGKKKWAERHSEHRCSECEAFRHYDDIILLLHILYDLITTTQLLG